jgi:hypothetical protein
VGGDSDSSALTQESGDEGGVEETPMESVVTGTDAGTDYADDEDVEMREASPGTHGVELLWSRLPLTLQHGKFRRGHREDVHREQGGEGGVVRRVETQRAVRGHGRKSDGLLLSRYSGLGSPVI